MQGTCFLVLRFSGLTCITFNRGTAAVCWGIGEGVVKAWPGLSSLWWLSLALASPSGLSGAGKGCVTAELLAPQMCVSTLITVALLPAYN